MVPGYQEITQLYNLIENEESPFIIAKQGMQALESTLAKNEDLVQYAQFIKKALAVRILQNLKKFYCNLKFTRIMKLLSFYSGDENNWSSIETLLYECNREGLVKTVVDHNSESITFDKGVQVIESLQTFGTKLKKAFVATREVAFSDYNDKRNRIFQKVKEKIDEDT